MIFRSFLQAGFECSTHFDPQGNRLDLIAETQHDRFVNEDYQRIAELGIFTARDGVRWHLIEKTPGQYDWSSLVPFVEASQNHGIQVIWDVLHYGLPDDLSYASPDLPKRFIDFAVAFTQFLKEHTDDPPFLTLVNEISFLAFSLPSKNWYNSSQLEASSVDAHQVKRMLVQMVMQAIDAIREIQPTARFVQTEPLIHIVTHNEHQAREVQDRRNSQFEVWDMLRGTASPELGGDPKYLDILGLNHFPYSQWVEGGGHLHFNDELFMPLSVLSQEIQSRYNRPFFISETSVEGDDRAAWFEYVYDNVEEARRQGAQVEGICLYPILDYPAWDDSRVCSCGLWGFPDDEGYRNSYEPLLKAVGKRTL